MQTLVLQIVKAAKAVPGMVLVYVFNIPRVCSWDCETWMMDFDLCRFLPFCQLAFARAGGILP